MSSFTTFTGACWALSHATAPDADLTGPFLDMLGVSGAAVSTLGRPFGSETVSASGPEVVRLCEMQMDLGEGPSWQAIATHEPVLAPDLAQGSNESWPLAWQALRDEGVAAVFAFPLVAAGLDVGALALYSDTARALSSQQVREVTALSMILARQVVRRSTIAAEHVGEDDSPWEGAYSRREVYQATGMVLAQMGISADDALVVLQGHAFATNRPVRDVAADVIARTLDFTSSTDQGI